MKSIMLSVVVIATLITAGIGGTFAHFSDTEQSLDNVVSVGSMDLKIKTKTPLGLPTDDPDVPKILVALDMQPCDSQDRTFIVMNTGQPEGDPCDLYIHFKNLRCEDVDDKLGNPKPEPEIVAEQGGWVDQVYVDGIGDDPCLVFSHMNVTIYYPWDQATGTGPVVYTGKMIDIVCENILLGDLPKCNERDVHVVFHLQDIPEEVFGFDYFDETDPEIVKKCWNAWPTNAMMKDMVTFDIMFSLVQGP